MRINNFAKLLISIALVCVGLQVGALIINGIDENHYHHAQHQAEVRAHFYRVVAGQDQPSSPSVAEQLALDLRQVPTYRLSSFQGNSNAYGGVSDTLGQEPFTNECGGDCGHLNATWLARVLRSRAGQVDEVVAADQPRKPGGGYTFLPLALAACALVAALLVTLRPALARRQRHALLRHQFPAECRTIDHLDAALASLPHGQQYQEMKQLRDGLESALQYRLAGGEETVENMRVDKLMSEARASLNAVEAGNKMLE